MKGGTLCPLSLFYAGILSGLNFCRTCTFCNNLCGFIWVQVLLCQKDAVSMESHITSDAWKASCLFFCLGFLALRAGFNKDNSLRAENSKISDSPHIVHVNVCDNYTARRNFSKEDLALGTDLRAYQYVIRIISSHYSSFKADYFFVMDVWKEQICSTEILVFPSLFGY